jgi:hypothetical protein
MSGGDPLIRGYPEYGSLRDRRPCGFSVRRFFGSTLEMTSDRAKRAILSGL